MLSDSQTSGKSGLIRVIRGTNYTTGYSGSFDNILKQSSLKGDFGDGKLGKVFCMISFNVKKYTARCSWGEVKAQQRLSNSGRQKIYAKFRAVTYSCQLMAKKSLIPLGRRIISENRFSNIFQVTKAKIFILESQVSWKQTACLASI